MADENVPMKENFNAAANLMSDALDRAGGELERTLKGGIAQLTISCQALEKHLTAELKKVVDQSKSLADANVEDISAHQEEILGRLEEIEVTEINAIVESSRNMRLELAARGQKASESISRLVEENIVELGKLIKEPQVHLTDLTSKELERLDRLALDGKQKIETHESGCAQSLTAKAQELDAALQLVISDTKKSVEKTVDTYELELEQRISTVIKQLSEFVSETLKDFQKKTKVASKTVQNAGSASKARLTEQLEEWQRECSALTNGFKNILALEATNAQTLQAAKLELKVDEVKDEINRISTDAQAKISANHKLFFSSLKRLESKYNEKMAKLQARVEGAIAEEARLNPESGVALHEARELLRARLQVDGAEILKSFQRQADQLASEYSRTMSGSNERLDTIRASTTDALYRQSRKLRNELERVSREFNNDLTELSNQLPQIEEAGRAAAMAIMTYRSATLEFEHD